MSESRDARAAPIVLDGLRSYFKTTVALDGIDATIVGRITGLLGPNGAGKSTLLKCMLGLIGFEGEARVLGLDSRTDGARIRDRVGYMPEQDALVLGLDAVQLCTFVGELSGLPRNAAIERAHFVLDHVGIQDKRYQAVEGFSTGLKQRVKLAQALVHDPEVLFLDEPTSGLDPRSRDAMLALIEELPERCACSVVLSTHLLHDVERVCDHALILDRGKLRFCGTVAELRGLGTRTGMLISVDGQADRLAALLAAAGARCAVRGDIELVVHLPPHTTSELVFTKAHEVGVQIRGVAPDLESVEAAFFQIITASRGAPSP